MVVKGEIVEECDSTMCREALMLGRGSRNSGVNAFEAFGRAREGQRWYGPVVLLKLSPCHTHEL